MENRFLRMQFSNSLILCSCFTDNAKKCLSNCCPIPKRSVHFGKIIIFVQKLGTKFTLLHFKHSPIHAPVFCTPFVYILFSNLRSLSLRSLRLRSFKVTRFRILKLSFGLHSISLRSPSVRFLKFFLLQVTL